MTASSDSKIYTLDDLADALLAARRYQRAEPDGYLVRRGQAFERAFGLAGHADAETSLLKQALGGLLESTLRSMLSFSSPTAGYFEAPRELEEFADRFTKEIARARAELDRVLRTMLLALLEELVTPGRTTVTNRDLVEHGFDPTTETPDSDDFW